MANTLASNPYDIDFTQYPDYPVDLNDWYFDTSFGPSSHAPTNLVEQEHGRYAGTMVSPQFATDAGGKPMFTEYLPESGDLYNKGLTSENPFSPGNTMRVYKNPETGDRELAAYYPPMLNPRASGEHGWAPNAASQYAILKQMQNPTPIKDMTKGYYSETDEEGDLLRELVAGTYFAGDVGDKIDVTGLNLRNLSGKSDAYATLGHEIGGHGQADEWNENIEGLSQGETLNPAYLAREFPDVAPGSYEYNQIIADMLAEHKAKNKMGIFQSLKRNIFGGGNPPFPKYVEQASERHGPIYSREAMHNPSHDYANYVNKGYPMAPHIAGDDLKIQNYSRAMHDELLQPRTDRILNDLNASFPDRPSRQTPVSRGVSLHGGSSSPSPRRSQVGPPGYNYSTGGIVSLAWPT